ncbi:astacin (Peptidase family m12A) domain-containing protein [Phthorimaea operculella]|nr:astacin (Peptidase family m12A) domain-containing protein [Phthorimaea operculella]
MHLSYILVFIIVYNTPYGESTVRRALHGDSNMTLSDAEDEGKPNKPRSKETEKENLNITSEADGIKKLLDHGDAEIVDMETTDENENDENSSETDEEQSYKKYYNEKIGQVSEVMGNMWPLGIIPYKVDMSSYDSVLASRVRDAMDFLEGVSCVQFKHLSNNTEGHFVWIHITNPEGQRECSHEPKKKRSGEIVLILGLECLKKREILHSLLHGIGFGDEVTHHLRDQYVRIMWENIQPKYQHLFVYSLSWPRLEKEVIEEYDPMSIMHFHDRAFSKNGQATIVPLMPGLQIQPSEKLSQLDKMKLRLAFGHECNRRTLSSGGIGFSEARPFYIQNKREMCARDVLRGMCSEECVARNAFREMCCEVSTTSHSPPLTHFTASQRILAPHINAHFNSSATHPRTTHFTRTALVETPTHFHSTATHPRTTHFTRTALVDSHPKVGV